MINKTTPQQVDHKPVLPIQGTSLAYSFDHPKAETQKHVQYFETAGDRAIWMDGWKAVTRHTQGQDYEKDTWELFYTEQDFSEIRNLSKTEPEKLAALVALWHREAERDNVLPMEDDLLTLYKKCVPAARKRYLFYPGMTRLDRLSAPDITTYDSQFTADVDLRTGEADGVILSAGDSGAGYEWFIKDGHLVFVYVYTRSERYRLQSSSRVRNDISTLGLSLKIEGDGATLTMTADSKELGRLIIPKMWQVYAPNSGMRCGENQHSPISREYQPPFAFGKGLKRVSVDLLNLPV